MFQNNLGAIEIKNKSLAEKLSKIKIEDIKQISVTKAENGDYILVYNGVALHDLKDPMREAKSIWYRNIKKELKPNDIQIVFGLGLGYLFKRAYVSANSRVFLFEPSLEILRFVLEYVDFSKEILDDRVSIFNDKEEIINSLRSVFLVGDNIEFIYLPAYASLFKEDILNLSSEVFDVIKNKTIDMNTINANKSTTSVKNTLYHIGNFRNIRSLDCLAGIFEGKTALIVAAGPSLKNDIEKIKKFRDKFVIFSVAQAMNVLEENDITPDFMVASDVRTVTTLYNRDKVDDVSIIFEGRAQSALSSEKFKHKICYFSDTDSIMTALTNNFSGKITTHQSSLSVSILAFYAAKTMGFSDIAYSGLDLAIIDNEAYAKNEFVQSVSEDKLIFNYNGKKTEKKLVKIKSADGKEVFTREDYLLFIKQFEDILKSPENHITSTSKKGAFINGMEYKTLEEIASSVKTPAKHVQEDISKAFSSSRNMWEEFVKTSYEYIKSQKDALDLLYQKTVFLHEKTKELKDFADSDDLDLMFLKTKYDEIKDDLSYLRSNIMNNVVLSAYMQADLLEYVQSYNQQYLQNIDIFRNNINEELKLCVKIMEKYEDLKTSMENVLDNYYEKNS